MDELPPQHHLPRVLRFFDISVLSSASMGPAYSLASTMGFWSSRSARRRRSRSSCSRDHAVHRDLIRDDGSRRTERGLLVHVDPFDVRRRRRRVRRVAADPLEFFRNDGDRRSGGHLHARPGLARARAGSGVGRGRGAIWIVASSVLLYVGIRPTAVVTLIALLFEMGVLAAAAIAAYVAPPPTSRWRLRRPRRTAAATRSSR